MILCTRKLVCIDTAIHYTYWHCKSQDAHYVCVGCTCACVRACVRVCVDTARYVYYVGVGLGVCRCVVCMNAKTWCIRYIYTHTPH